MIALECRRFHQAKLHVLSHEVLLQGPYVQRCVTSVDDMLGRWIAQGVVNIALMAPRLVHSVVDDFYTGQCVWHSLCAVDCDTNSLTYCFSEGRRMHFSRGRH